jgi:hypothetical protein
MASRRLRVEQACDFKIEVTPHPYADTIFEKARWTAIPPARLRIDSLRNSDYEMNRGVKS